MLKRVERGELKECREKWGGGPQQGKDGEGSSRSMCKGPMDKAKGGKDGGWEVRISRAGESGGRKMETTVLEQQ